MGRVCIGCGCTDADACIDRATGEPCYWVHWFDGALCSACARIAARVSLRVKDAWAWDAMRVNLALDEEQSEGTPLVELFDENAADAAIRELRAGGPLR